MLKWSSTVRPRRTPPLSEVQVLRRTWLLNVAAAYHPVRTRCWTRSIALARLLGREGEETRLRIGVCRGEHPFAAHAWLEWNGRVLNDDRGVYRQFTALEAAHGPRRS
jgi:hypothetical protein